MTGQSVRAMATASAAVGAVVCVDVTPDGTRGVVLPAIALAASAVLIAAGVRHAEARPAWWRYAGGGSMMAANLAFTYHAPPLEMNALASFAGIGAVILASAGALVVARPLLSYGPTRRGTQWAAAMHLFGGLALVFTDSTTRELAGGRALYVATVVLLLTGAGMLVVVARGASVLREAGRTVDLEVGIATALCALLVGVAAVDIERLWSIGGLAALVVLAGASLGPSGGSAGCPVRSRPVITPVSFGSALVAATPLIALIPAVHLGAPPAVAAGCILATVPLAHRFQRHLRSAAPRAARVPARLSAIAAALPDAIVFDQFERRDDPIVRIHDGVTVGYEARLQWAHPTMGDIAATELLLAADACGIRAEVESHLLVTACRRLPEVIGGLSADEPFLSVDVSPSTLESDGFAAALIERVVQSGATLDGLVVEISDSGEVHDWPAFRHNVAALQDAGVLVALDDFGGGTSNLRYLSEVDVDLVKIDPALLTMLDGQRSRAVLTHLLAIARHAGARVVANGLDGDHVLALAGSLGFDFAQGPAAARRASLAATDVVAPAPVRPR